MEKIRDTNYDCETNAQTLLGQRQECNLQVLFELWVEEIHCPNEDQEANTLKTRRKNENDMKSIRSKSNKKQNKTKQKQKQNKTKQKTKTKTKTKNKTNHCNMHKTEIK